jgi:uncharacterized protein (DUF885 family)
LSQITRWMKPRAFFCALVFVLALIEFSPVSFAQTQVAPIADQGQIKSRKSPDLARIITDYEAYSRAEDPIAAGQEGYRAALSKLPGITPADTARRLKALTQFQSRLARVPARRLGGADQLNLTFLKRVVDMSIESIQFDPARLGFTNEGGPENLLSDLSTGTIIRTVEDAEAYLARLDAAEKFINASKDNMRRGVASGFVQSRQTAEAALSQLKSVLSRNVTSDSGLVLPLAKLPDSISAAQQASLRERTLSIINTKIRPAQEAFTKVVEAEVLPVAKPEIGALHLPGGKAYYTHLARLFTTTNLNPDQIHEIGVKEVARIRGEMMKEMAAAGFKGTFAEFLNFLRTDRRFYASTREELMEKSARIAKLADNELPKIFGTLPRLSYGVREVPRDIEENYTSGRYNLGSPQLGISGGLMVNTSHLDQRPLYEHPALMLHEGVPGHHLQIAIQQELGNQPWFRRNAEVTAFVEGWGLYAEFLGLEMGIYRDPYERFGKLSMEMWRACRLVVDTGIHWKGWTLDQARTCFTENSALAPKNIENELQRYIAGPGQALAYKIGEMKLRELRQKAETVLGGQFDLRRFHDAVLWGGPLPLDLLESQIDAWIAREKIRHGSAKAKTT